MGRRCCIAGCSSTSRLTEHQGVTYHSFPSDSTIRSIWLRNTRVSTDRKITKSVLVCSRHFRRMDFQTQRSGKFLLKHGVFPTVFSWGRVDPAQIDADTQQMLASGGGSSSTAHSVSPTDSSEDATKATVEATVAQIMAQTAELNAAAGVKANASVTADETGSDGRGGAVTTPPAGVRFESVTSFNPGTRLEAQDFDGLWHIARVVEVDNDDREVLIKFERTGKTKSSVAGTEEWIPMISTRLRQKVSTRPIPVFALDDKCLARWSGPRKFPGTVKKVFSNDTYEVLFDDGYVKNVRAIHMSKIAQTNEVNTSTGSLETPKATADGSQSAKLLGGSDSSSGKKRSSQGTKKDWPLLDMSKLDLSSLNLPEIPHDGEWTCHWVNDQPIGRDGYLIVGEHRKPTVIVEDWRLPQGWVKHMYQRSNVLGKWDVILVTPNKKRFRSKADLKVYLEELGQFYNPDIYDFSIHRRRAKDINAYVYTSDYTPQQLTKSKPAFETSISSDLAASLDSTAAAAALASLAAGGSSEFIETPVATPVPPMELMTPTSSVSKAAADLKVDAVASPKSSTPTAKDSGGPNVEDGFAYIGGLKVEIVDNLFRCPQVGCSKNFRKENHLQIHVKHYHSDLNKLLGTCPKMQELAEKRTHNSTPEPNEPQPKNQISNQQFFAKLYQQDLQQTRSQRRTHNAEASPIPVTREHKTEDIGVKVDLEDSAVNNTISTNDASMLNVTAKSSYSEQSAADESGIATKRSRYSPSKRMAGARKSNRQRTARHYLTTAHTKSGAAISHRVVTADSSFGPSDFEETRHSFNATPDAAAKGHSLEAKRRRTRNLAGISMSSIDSPITADSGSSSFLPLQSPFSNDTEHIPVLQSHYIKENGELIKIVRMRQEEIINCLCSYGEEDGLMIQCELCLCWQHGICNGIDKESDVPDKYVCYICRNPQRGRESMRFKHDQDWLFEGKLPVANYHIANPALPARFEYLKRSHQLTGNIIELKQFMHSLRVKINIANNRAHPKLYLWAKKWDDDPVARPNIKNEPLDEDIKPLDVKVPIIPQPEAPIDPVECQQRLLEHIKVQQNLVMNRLSAIEVEIDVLEKQDPLPKTEDADLANTKDILAIFIKELEILKDIAKINLMENAKKALKPPIIPDK